MAEFADVQNFSVDLDIIGQQSGLNMYTQLCLCFELPDFCLQSTVTDTLTKGLEKLSASFPWVAGQIVNQGASKGDSGVFAIKPFEKTPRLVVKDLRHDPSIPPMSVMKEASFPLSMLDESIVAPLKTFSQRELDESTKNLFSYQVPVFVLQATFIQGGLLLTFLGQHQAMDIAGQGQIMHLLSKACRNETFTSDELSSGNLPRRHIIPVLSNPYEPGPELDDQIIYPNLPLPRQSPASATIHPIPSAPRNACANFTFSPPSLRTLKAFATESISHTAGYISTDDALSALIWQSLSRVRLSRLENISPTSFARAVDVRRYLNIPRTYPGIIHNMTYHRSTLQQLVSEPLGAIASDLRVAVDPKTSNLEYNTRSLATFLDRSPDKSNISFLARFGPEADIMLSSWANEKSYELDFGLGLGRPEAVRRPQFSPKRTLVYFLPRKLDGEITVSVFTREVDLEKLRLDEEFMRFAKFVG